MTARFFYFLFSLAIWVLVAAAAIAALTRIYRLMTTGFLQGVLWVAVPALITAIVDYVEFSHLNDVATAAWDVEVISLTLGTIAAILLMISWSQAAERRQARQISGLPLLVVGAAGLSQVPVLIFCVQIGNSLNDYTYFAQGSVGVLLALAVTWYAMSLQTRALGGAMVVGWATAAAMLFSIDVSLDWPLFSYAVPMYWFILGYILLAAVVVVTVIYLGKPSDLNRA
jgi:hypothetical protein